MSALALQLIQEAKEKRLTKLDLGNCGLEKIPEEIFELDWLEELNLGAWYLDFSSQKYLRSQNQGEDNSLKYISLNQRFPKLQAINLSYNQLTDISFLRGLIRKGIPVKWENDYAGEGIIVEENPLTTPPPEIVKRGVKRC